jgi:hypothetical protein
MNQHGFDPDRTKKADDRGSAAGTRPQQDFASAGFFAGAADIVVRRRGIREAYLARVGLV